jgi:hypothetical protein
VTGAFPEWAFSPFETCSTGLRDIGRVHRASLLGLRAIVELPKYLPQLLSPAQKRELAEFEMRIRHSIESTAKTAETVKVDIRRDVRLINASAVVSLWSALEVGIEDFLIAWMMNQRGTLSVPAAENQNHACRIR